MNSRRMLKRIKYRIEPNPMCGWDFRIEGSKHIIKYDSDRKKLKLFAQSYCRTHECELRIFNLIGEIEDSISFGADKYPE